MKYRNEYWSIDTDAFRLERNGKPCSLEPQVFDLIVYLIEHRERVVTRDELLDNLWQGRIVSESAINARIKLARKALGDSGKQQHCIKTIHRRGYQFVAAIDAPLERNRSASTGTVQQALIPGTPSIAVLAFDCSSDDAADRDLAEGLSTVIIANLSCYRELLVIDPQSAFSYRDGQDNIAGFAARLGVDYIVNGSVRRSGARVRISVQLIEIKRNKTIWVQRLDRNLQDMFDLEDEVASQVAINLVGQIDDKNRSRVRFQRPENLSAFDCVVRARPQVESQQPGENQAARILLQQALELDPGYATACALLALNYCAEYESAWCEAADETLQQAFAYAQQAIALDNFDSNAHVAMGATLMHRQKFDLAAIHLDQAIECNPNCYNAFCFKSWLLALSGRSAEAEACGATALRLNPLAPDDCLMAIMLGHYTQASYSAALDLLARIQQPYDESEAFRAACLAQLGRDREAQQAVDAAIVLGGADICSAHWLRSWTFRNPQDREHVLEGLYLAGLLSRPETAREKPSIAVLQFSNQSADPKQAYFSSGMATNICSRLSKIRSLLVKFGFSYTTGQHPAASIAKELEVNYLLAGAVLREGERVRVSVELIEGSTGAIKWSEHFDRSGNMIIDIQDDIARAITATLWGYDGTINEAERERGGSKPAHNFSAFDYILQGIHYKDQYSVDGGRKAHACFDRAIALDPKSADACGWSAWAHMVDISMGWSSDHADSLAQAFELARRAIAHDPHSEMGHWALAEAHILQGDHANGFREFARAAEINPSNPDLMVTWGTELASNGRFDEGIELVQQGIRLNRHHPEWYYWHLGIAYFAAGRLDDAIESFARLNDQNKDSCTFLTACYAHTGKLPQARKYLTELNHHDPGTDLDDIAQTHAYLNPQARERLLDGVRLAMSD